MAVPDFSSVNRPVKDRIATFETRPNDRQLGADLGYGLMGGSNITVKDTSEFLKVEPEQIPILGVGIWMYFVLAVLYIFLIWLGDQDKVGWAMLLFGAIVIVPTMMAGFSWINEQTGNEPYLALDRSTDTVTLPRLSVTFERKNLKEVICLDRFVDGNRFWQVALLVEEDQQWKYVHLFNEAGTGTGMEWLGFKDLYQKIGDSLGIDSRRLKFSKKESESLGS